MYNFNFSLFSKVFFLTIMLAGTSLFSKAQIENEGDSLIQFMPGYEFDISTQNEDPELADLTPLKVGVLLSDIYSKKDMEFLRGFLLGLDQAELPAGTISLKVMNGEAGKDSIVYQLERFEPDIIFTTHEKDVPAYLLETSLNTGSLVFNVFDTKGEDYKNVLTVNELLPPSAPFNMKASERILQQLGDGVLIVVGPPDSSDAILNELKSLLPETSVLELSKEELSTLELGNDTHYFIYPTTVNKDDIKSIISNMQGFYINYPMASVKLIGRPNWVTFNDLNSIVSNLDVVIPAKCYFDPATPDSKKFISDYKTKFGHTPIRSYPVYSAMGYDVARYFLPVYVMAINDIEVQKEPKTMLQSRFNMVRSDIPEGGDFNDSGFLLHFLPWGAIERIPLDIEE